MSRELFKTKGVMAVLATALRRLSVLVKIYPNFSANLLDRDITLFKDGQLLTPPTFSKSRPLSIKVSNYLSLSGGITIT